MVLLSTALALEYGAAAGLSRSTNDPFQISRGLEVTGIVGPSHRFAVEFRGAYLPSLGESSWSPLTSQLVNQVQISPDLSAPLLRADIAGAWTPLVTQHGGWTGRGGVFVGAGAVYTVDDLEALQAEGDPQAIATQHQVHPTGLYGLLFEASYGPIGVRLRSQRLVYTEVVNSTTLESKRPQYVSLELLLRS